MASLYQRFTGKINTNKSFPNPPEASHLLGQSVEGESAAQSQRTRFQQHGRRCEDEDVRNLNCSHLYLSECIFWPLSDSHSAL